MSGDYVQRLRAFLDTREARGDAWRGTISVAHGDGARTGEGPGMYRRPLTDVDLRAALDELEQLRAERQRLRVEWGTRWEDHERVEGFGYGPDAEESARSLTHPRDTLMTRLVGVWGEAESAPQQPEREGGD